MTSKMSTDARPRYASLQQDNPVRRPDWRWQRAQSLIDDRSSIGRCRDDDDELTVWAVSYLSALRCGTVPDDDRRVPDIAAAHDLEGQPELRLELQCRILAGQSSDEIAARLQITPDVVETYEALFFHTTDRLAAPDWILLQAVGRRPFTGTTPPDRETLLRWLAYAGGPVVLDLVLPHVLPEAAGCRTRKVDQDPLLSERIDLLICMMTLPSDDRSAMQLMQSWPKLQSTLAQRSAARDQAILEDSKSDLLSDVFDRVEARTKTGSGSSRAQPESIPRRPDSAVGQTRETIHNA